MLLLRQDFIMFYFILLHQSTHCYVVAWGELLFSGFNVINDEILLTKSQEQIVERKFCRIKDVLLSIVVWLNGETPRWWQIAAFPSSMVLRMMNALTLLFLGFNIFNVPYCSDMHFQPKTPSKITSLLG